MKSLLKCEEVKYIVNEKKKTVAAVATFRFENYTSHSGIFNCISETGVAKCSPEDTFNEYKGKDIAYDKAKIKALRYLSVELEHIKKSMLKEFENLDKMECNFAVETLHLINNKDEVANRNIKGENK